MCFGGGAQEARPYLLSARSAKRRLRHVILKPVGSVICIRFVAASCCFAIVICSSSTSSIGPISVFALLLKSLASSVNYFAIKLCHGSPERDV